MRRLQKAFSSLGLAVAAFGAVASGCWPFDFTDDCERSFTCKLSGDGGTPAKCVPSQNTNAVDSACGVFASDLRGDDTLNDGTKDKPFKTLAKAFGEANGKPVYACSETFAEAVTLSAGSELYGGLDCTQAWTYSETSRTTIAPGADQIPLTLSSGSATTKVENVVARAADATVPGGSSIAAIVDAATAEIKRCDFAAGAGANGADGETLPADPTLNGTPGNPGADACMGSVNGGNPGGLSAAKACDGGDTSVGGKGGDGGKIDPGPPLKALPAGDGEDGQPVGTGGAKGTGETDTAG